MTGVLKERTATHPSGDSRFELIDKALKRAAYRKDALIEILHTAQEVFGYLADDVLLYEEGDALFMTGPLLIEAFHLKGDKAYLDMADRNLRQIQKWCLREDGLYRHSPLDDAAWGRGNGFPAVGLTWMLEGLPQDDPRYDAWLKMYREHMQALATHQNQLGMWHQVIDKLDSYQEYTATCMIAWAMSRGVRNGWLEEEEYTPRIERAWQGILRRTGTDGHLIDVCTGTGKQPNLESYYNRTAILGRDDRGGAMGLLLAVEMAHWPEPGPQK
jgi:rhamnogalacturonyl hydrolase YesR